MVTGIDERRRALTKGERTHDRLLRAAVDRFGSDGYRGTSVSQLSRDAGLTPAAAYAYFPHKEAFWKAAVAADLDELRAEVQAVVANSDRPILDSVYLLVEGLQSHALARRVMVEGSAQDLQLVLTHPLFASTTQLVGAILAERQASGTIAAHVDVAKLAVGIETVIFTLVLALVRARMADLPGRVDAAVTLLHIAAGGPPTAGERRRRPEA